MIKKTDNWQEWFDNRQPPDDDRDVVVQIWKPIWNDQKKRMEKGKSMEVACFSEGAWWIQGLRWLKKDVIQWTEIPDGWQSNML